MPSGRCSPETLAPEYQQAVSDALLTATCHPWLPEAPDPRQGLPNAPHSASALDPGRTPRGLHNRAVTDPGGSGPNLRCIRTVAKHDKSICRDPAGAGGRPLVLSNEPRPLRKSETKQHLAGTVAPPLRPPIALCPCTGPCCPWAPGHGPGPQRSQSTCPVDGVGNRLMATDPNGHTTS